MTENPRTRLFAFIVACASLGILVFYFSQGTVLIDYTGHLFGHDFVNVYLGGNLLESGNTDTLFDQSRYMEALHNWLGPTYPIHNWSYPPTMFWIAEAVSKLPYMAAFISWTLLGLLAISLTIRALGHSWIWVFCVAFSPAATWNIFAGQNGFFTASFLTLAILFATRNRPITAAFFWALATVKPHLGLLALPMLILNKHMRIILVGGIIFAGMVVLTALRYSSDSWIKFFTVTTKQQKLVVENWSGILESMMPTMFMQGRLAGLSLTTSYLLHFGFAIICVWLLYRAWDNCKHDIRGLITWFALGTFLLLPYSFVYDLVLFQIMLILWSKEPEKLFHIQSHDRATLLWMQFWMLPYLSYALASLANIQITPLMLIWLLTRFQRNRFVT